MSTEPPTNPINVNPRFFDIWATAQFDSQMLAALAGVDEREIILPMFRGSPVARTDAEKVLAALSRMLGRDYNLRTVRVVLQREDVMK